MRKNIFSRFSILFNGIFGPAILFLKNVDQDHSLLKRFIFVVLNIVFLEIIIVPLIGIGFDFIINPEKGTKFLDFHINTEIYFLIALAYIFARIISFKKIYSEKYKFSIRLPYDYIMTIYNI